MNMRVQVLVSMCACMAGQNIASLPIPYETPYNLRTDQAYTHYLPGRVTELTRIIQQQGIDAACAYVKDDRDLDSFLFILQLNDPVKMLAYSRQTQFADKTAQEIQSLIFPDCKTASCNVQTIFTNLMATARKGDTYYFYEWRLSVKDAVQYQTAYVHERSVQENNYIVGAARFTDRVPDHIILKHRVKTVAARIKKEGLEAVMQLISHDPDAEMYFYVKQQDYPYRYIVHGRNQEFNNKTPAEVQKMTFPNCDNDDCNLQKRYINFQDISRKGGGFYAYLSGRSEKKSKLKVAYIEPFKYKGTNYFVASGYEPVIVPKTIKDELPKKIDHVLNLIKEVGLNNTVSLLRRKNKPESYVFIREAQDPYLSVLHNRGEFIGKTPTDAQRIIQKECRGDRECPDDVALVKQEIRFAQRGGGFYAYLWESDEPGQQTYLKISFLKPLSIGGKKYYVGAGYLLG